MAISTNHKPTIYRNLYENTDPVVLRPFSKRSLEIGVTPPRSRTKHNHIFWSLDFYELGNKWLWKKIAGIAMVTALYPYNLLSWKCTNYAFCVFSSYKVIDVLTLAIPI